MKIAGYAFVILLFMNCKNSGNARRLPITATKTTVDNPDTKSDTINKISRAFEINGIKSHWNHQFIKDYDARLILKNHNTNQTLIDTDFILFNELTAKHQDADYFDEINRRCFVDLNFDGFKDFQCPDNGSNGAMSNATLVYLFSPETSTFTHSEELSEGVLLNADSINYKLISLQEFRRGQDSIVRYFDRSKSGRIKFTESFVKYSTFGETDTWFIEEYRKIVDGKTVETKRDSTTME